MPDTAGLQHYFFEVLHRLCGVKITLPPKYNFVITAVGFKSETLMDTGFEDVKVDTFMVTNRDGDPTEFAAVIQAWENKHYPLDLPDPVDAIKFRMEQSGLSVKDLEPLIGKSNRVYEVLSRKRPLTLAMIRRLHKSLGIPADVLIAETAAG